MVKATSKSKKVQQRRAAKAFKASAIRKEGSKDGIHDDNAFEKVWSRKKFSILGRDKSDRRSGAVVNVSKSRSSAKIRRQETLLQEYKTAKKAGKFVDKRFGEGNDELDEDEKAILRLQKVRLKQLRKGMQSSRTSKYNLDDDGIETFGEDTELTHGGVSIKDPDLKFTADGDDDEIDAEEDAKIDMAVVNQLHFGGGRDQAESETTKSAREIYAELVAKSKVYKAEKQREREEDQSIREKLDMQFQALIKSNHLINQTSTEQSKGEADDFDKETRIIGLEMRERATDRTKTAEEIALEHKQKMEDMEKQRIIRMHGKSEEEDSDNEPLEEEQESDGEDQSDDAEGEESDDSSESDKADQIRDSSEANDSTDGRQVKEQRDGNEIPYNSGGHNVERNTSSKALEDLPYTLPIPENFSELENLLKDRDSDQVYEIIKRIRSANPPALNAEKRRGIQGLFNMLLRYLAVIAGQRPISVDIINLGLLPNIVELAQEIPLFAGKAAREWISSVQRSLTNGDAKGSGESRWPSARVLLLFRVFMLIFSTSDRRHSVITPLNLLIGHCLTLLPVSSRHDIVSGLYMVTLAYHSIKHSGRVFPEALQFLLNLLRTVSDSVVSPSVMKDKWLSLEQPVGWEPTELCGLGLVSIFESQSTESNESSVNMPGFKSQTLWTVADLVKAFLKVYQDHHVSSKSLPETFGPFLELFSIIIKSKSFQNSDSVEGRCIIPSALIKKIETIFGEMSDKVKEVASTRKPLWLLRSLPAPIRQYNPRFEEDFEVGRDYDPDRERAASRKLRRQVAKEKRGARRELRKDNVFLTEERNREKNALVDERNAELRKGLIFLEEQQADWKSGSGGGGSMKKRIRLRDAKSLMKKPKR